MSRLHLRASQMIKLLSIALLVLIVYAAIRIINGLHTSDIKSDENVILFPTHANFTHPNWNVTIHGWIFEPEDDSIWRSAMTKTFINSLGLDENAVKEDTFRERISMFLVDNERNKQVKINIANQIIQSEKSGPNGHFYTTATLAADALKSTSDGWLEISLLMPASNRRAITGHVQFIHESGVSVISDIDDTVKISNTMDIKELVKNTFVEPFKAVPGMPQAYMSWEKQGAVFHYVSSSPWQLYPALNKFFEDSGLPSGSLHLKQFRTKDQSFFDLFASPMESKIPTISQIIEKYPNREFILVGDSGEKDPEVYDSIFQTYRDQIRHIFIRNVTGETADSSRYQDIFKNINRKHWTVFDDPTILKDLPIYKTSG